MRKRKPSWRRREGVEPSGDLTAPRLVLKTSGTTGHLPSPLLKNNWLTRMPGPVKIGCVTNVTKLLVVRIVTEWKIDKLMPLCFDKLDGRGFASAVVSAVVYR